MRRLVAGEAERERTAGEERGGHEPAGDDGAEAATAARRGRGRSGLVARRGRLELRLAHADAAALGRVAVQPEERIGHAREAAPPAVKSA